jgi:hypothetical protein
MVFIVTVFALRRLFVRVVNIVELLDEICSIGHIRGVGDIFACRLFRSIAYVVKHRGVKDWRLLLDKAKPRSQRFNCELFDVDASNCDGSLLWLIEAKEQLNERRFAAARLSSDANRLALFNLEAESFENPPLLARRVSEPYVLELDVSVLDNIYTIS